jgi:septum formation protein
VVTAVALVEVGRAGAVSREETAVVSSRVRMGRYSDAEIEAYVDTGEPFDKAGGYAVQGQGGRLVAAVEGCYTNVVGLPLTTTRGMLERWGLLRG